MMGVRSTISMVKLQWAIDCSVKLINKARNPQNPKGKFISNGPKLKPGYNQ